MQSPPKTTVRLKGGTTLGLPTMLRAACLVLTWASSLVPVSCFNLEPESAVIFTDPTTEGSFWGRDSYFGFSVALQNNQQTGSTWLVVGAPRANSSHYNPWRITEPGVIFKCDPYRQDSCKELFIDQEGNSNRLRYHDLKNEGWLGAALDSHPTFKNGRQVTGACAPRWRNQYETTQNRMNGACYWMNASLSDGPAYKLLPLTNPKKQIIELFDRNLYYHSHGQAGMSIHFPDDHREMIIGAPGIFNWQGSVIHLKDNPSSNPFPVRQQISERQMFRKVLAPNPYFTNSIRDFDLNGYAVTSGRFYNRRQLLYVSGAPRGASMHGTVLLFQFPDRESSRMFVLAEWKGSQLGENFGASLVSADINGDGLSDLVVGSPMFSGTDDEVDMGRIQVFISTRDIGLMKASSHSGSNQPQARFGTTLGSLGNVNQDRYDDIAVGAPYEDEGRGAVYIYLGSNFGLRSKFSQRLTPSDIAPAVNLRGFGMSLSRGIDIDNNGYPDLAIGSFASGHAVVLRSRSVASLTGTLASNPAALALEDTSFKIEACIAYEGTHVPQTVMLYGNITLDHGHPSPRASFSDSDIALKNFTREVVQGTDKNCWSYDVKLDANKVDVRQPVLVKLDWNILETPGQLLRQPQIDPAAPHTRSLPIRILTDCDDDGDNICSIDLHVEASFTKYKPGQQLIIGSDNRPVLEISVTNTAESVFLPNVTITVPKPFALFLPASHSCDFTIEGVRSELVCQLRSPIKKDDEETLEVAIDASRVTDTSQELTVDVKVTGDGTEMDASDNISPQALKLMANAALELRGYSRGEQIHYSRLDEDTINKTIPKASFTHHYTLLKSGPTPLEKVQFDLSIPVNFTGGVNFITLYAPKTNFRNQPFQCTVQGAPLAIEDEENGEGTINNFDGNNEEILRPGPRKDDDSFFNGFPWTTESDGDSQNSSRYQMKTFDCSSPLVSCAQLQCQINSWPGGLQSAEFSIKMDINFRVLAAGYIFARAGAVVKSTAKASMISLNQDLAFQGSKNATGTADTDFLPLSLPGRSIPWWIILLAVLAGLLLLILLAVALHKLGFFKRNKHEDMREEKAQLKKQNSYGAVEEN